MYIRVFNHLAVLLVMVCLSNNVDTVKKPLYLVVGHDGDIYQIGFITRMLHLSN